MTASPPSRTHGRPRRWWVVLAAALSMALLDPATAVAADVAWSVAPSTGGAPDSRISLRHVTDPGAYVDDEIIVTNLGSQPAEYLVAAGDGVVGADGAFDIAAGEPTRAGRWITVGGTDAGRLTLNAGEARALPVRIDVPADAVPGDHPAGIVVGVSDGSDGVTVTHRMGVRLHLQVAGEIAAQVRATHVEASFTPSWIPFAPGVLHVSYDVENTGNVRLGDAAEVAVAGPFGVAPASATAAAGELLPGDVARRTVAVEAWPMAVLWGTVTVTPTAIGEDQLTAAAAQSAGFLAAAVSWTGLVALVAIGGLVVWVWRRRVGRVDPVDA